MSKRRRDEDEESDDGSDVEDLLAAGIGADEDGDADFDGDDSDGDDGSQIGAAAAAGGGGYKRITQQHVNNVAGLKQALASIRQDLPWIERLEVVSAEPLAVENINDDLKVELAFYGQALAAVTAARSEFERLGVPHRRPDDYFAEMLKSDDHMKKIKEKLVNEQKRMSAVEQRKKEKEAAAFSKQVQSEKIKSKAADKKQDLDAIKQWRKHKDSNGAGGGSSNEKELEEVFNKIGAGNKGSFKFGQGKGGDREGRGDRPAQKSGRRMGKDTKYGFGGKKREGKSNDSKSSGDMSGFSAKKMKSSLPPGLKPKGSGFGNKGGKKNAGANRPGKRARVAGKGGKGGK